MIAPIGLIILAVIVAAYFLLYRLLLSKISVKKFSLIGFLLSIVAIVYFGILAALGQSIMPCSLVPSFLAQMEPIFLRDLVGYLVGVSPLLGLLSGVALFKKNKAYSIAIIALSIIGIILTSVFEVCIQY